MTKYILTSPTGNLGSRVLASIIEHNLIPLSDLTLTTSASAPTDDSAPPRVPLAAKHNIPILYGVDFTKSAQEIALSFEEADVLFLSSYPSPSVERWQYHKNAIDAAILARVKCVAYTSLMFGGESGRESVCGVMQAHLKTIDHLEQTRDKARADGQEFDFIVLREGIYAESWWLYEGYQPRVLTTAAGGDKGEMTWVIPNDGKAAWVTWDDLGEGTAKVLADHQQYLGHSLRLTGPRATSLNDIARMVEQETGWTINVQLVGREEAKRHHVEKKSAGEGGDWVIESWSGWYDGLKAGECEVVDPLLENLLGRPPRGIEEIKSDLFKVHDRNGIVNEKVEGT